MWENMTFENIMQDMLDKVNDDMDKRQGSIIWDALAPAALELEAAYLIMEYTLNQAFPDTADREYLIRKAVERNLTPIPAKSAVVKGVFTPSDAEVTGLRFNLDNENFVVGEAIDGEAGAYKLVCETAGLEGNVSLGNLIPIDHIDGLTSAVATEFISLGTDEEDTEVFRERLLKSYKEISFGGNVKDYIEKCLSIDGVGGCRVNPAWNGGGTVKCYIIDSDYGAAASSLVNAVQEIIDPDQDGNGMGVAPIGHVVTIVGATEQSVNVYFVPEYETGYTWELVQDDVEEVLNNFFLNLRKNWSGHSYDDNVVVRISSIQTELYSVKGIAGASGVKLNNSTSNLTINADKIPVLGVITHA